ncbi:unnamed protein product [marine sediment metagenome]|uniref:Transcription factor zinc-finger domain-containing protein n=1 Tax=marine sediment metagenome TaxID=412755 RepID=X0WBB3_9ZZZZ
MDDEVLQFLADIENDQSFSENEQVVPHGERPCPICGEMMQVEVEHGVNIDACDQHGIWLDRDELPAIISKIRSGARLKRQRLVRQARTDGKKSGVIFGVWSLLFD